MRKSSERNSGRGRKRTLFTRVLHLRVSPAVLQEVKLVARFRPSGKVGGVRGCGRECVRTCVQSCVRVCVRACVCLYVNVHVC